jgi:hypothetical protein
MQGAGENSGLYWEEKLLLIWAKQVKEIAALWGGKVIETLK